MPTEEFERLKEALKEPPTEEARKEAAQRFREYDQAKKATGKPTSRPALVSLGYKKPYPSAVPVDKIPDEIAKNPAFYNLVKKVITKEK